MGLPSLQSPVPSSQSLADHLNEVEAEAEATISGHVIEMCDWAGPKRVQL